MKALIVLAFLSATPALAVERVSDPDFLSIAQCAEYKRVAGAQDASSWKALRRELERGRSDIALSMAESQSDNARATGRLARRGETQSARVVDMEGRCTAIAASHATALAEAAARAGG
jgi:hypothetical protein